MAQKPTQPRRVTGGALCCAAARFLLSITAANGALLLLASGCAQTSIENQIGSATQPAATESPAGRVGSEQPGVAEPAGDDAGDGRTPESAQEFVSETPRSAPGFSSTSGRWFRARSSRSAMELFQDHYQAQHYPEALAALRDALRDRPDDPEVLYLIALTHRAAGHPRLAEPSLNRAIEVHPDHLNSRKLLCMILMEDGRCAAATRHIDHVVKAGVADAEAYLLRASAHLRCGDCPAAEADATEALRLDAKLWQALLVRSAARLQAGRLDAAREDLEAVRAAGVPAREYAPLAAQIQQASSKAGN